MIKRVTFVNNLKHSKLFNIITAHPWCDDHSTSINAYEVWRAREGVQVFRIEFQTHIHLDWVRIKFLSFIYIYIYIKKKLFNVCLLQKNI